MATNVLSAEQRDQKQAEKLFNWIVRQEKDHSAVWGAPWTTIYPRVHLFVESAPYTASGSTCQLPSCGEKIMYGEYRIAAMVGTDKFHYAQRPGFYHIGCFEEIADLTNTFFVDRITPVTRSTFMLRGLREASFREGNNVLDGGAERLVLEWKSRVRRWIDKKNGWDPEPTDPALQNIMMNAGSSTFQLQDVENLPEREKALFLSDHAPYESDGAGDENEWNLFDEYLPSEDAMDEITAQHSLSEALGQWGMHVDVVAFRDEQLGESELEIKQDLGEKAIRAITRLSSVAT